MILLDTTVLVYAVGAPHRFRDPCRRLVAAIETGLAATTTTQVIQEFVHVRSRKHGRSDARTLGVAYLDLLKPLVVVDEDGLRDGLEIFEESDRLGAFDSLIAAAALREGAAVVSADTAFGAVPRLEHVVPDDAGVAELLGSGP